ncbi:hypothetical protein MESS2_30004 [Mesorhizobium metallidurans STM 2683]|uniref:Uncharacterized protein n=1 Tax=Mesorhizobium metallidurans STM 2683 TaxID=1297569 RepID=M5EPZ2_9HYPH|nr:hypothetical protein MESS2_30004 [Mesorhizobium metallidurans STM 2683]
MTLRHRLMYGHPPLDCAQNTVSLPVATQRSPGQPPQPPPPVPPPPPPPPEEGTITTGAATGSSSTGLITFFLTTRLGAALTTFCSTGALRTTLCSTGTLRTTFGGDVSTSGVGSGGIKDVQPVSPARTPDSVVPTIACLNVMRTIAS